MGAYGVPGTGTHAQIDAELLRSFTNGDTEVTQTDCRLVGFNHHYHIIRYNGVPQVIVATTIQRYKTSQWFGDGEWVYRQCDETGGPVIDDCPLDLLEKCPEPEGYEYAAQWRERVKAYHASKPKRVSLANLKSGDKIRLRDGLTVKGWLTVAHVRKTGSTGRGRQIYAGGYYIKPGQIAEVEAA